MERERERGIEKPMRTKCAREGARETWKKRKKEVEEGWDREKGSARGEECTLHFNLDLSVLLARSERRALYHGPMRPVEIVEEKLANFPSFLHLHTPHSF